MNAAKARLANNLSWRDGIRQRAGIAALKREPCLRLGPTAAALLVRDPDANTFGTHEAREGIRVLLHRRSTDTASEPEPGDAPWTNP